MRLTYKELAAVNSALARLLADDLSDEENESYIVTGARSAQRKVWDALRKGEKTHTCAKCGAEFTKPETPGPWPKKCERCR